MLFNTSIHKDKWGNKSIQHWKYKQGDLNVLPICEWKINFNDILHRKEIVMRSISRSSLASQNMMFDIVNTISVQWVR